MFGFWTPYMFICKRFAVWNTVKML